MNTSARLLTYGAAVVLIGAGAFGVGTTVDTSAAPASTSTTSPAAATHGSGHGAGHGGEQAGASTSATSELPPGLASSQRGYTFEPLATTLPGQTATEIAFRIVGPDGAPVTGYDVAHDKQMHLIVVRSDTADFQHLHPTLSPDGVWRVPVTFAAGGTYRALADFQPTGGEALKLGVDLFVPGDFAPISPQPSRTALVDGFEVNLAGDLRPGQASDITLTVSRGGVPVTDLQPYLGAYGHLVALRTGDLAYLHVHPHGSPGDGTTTPGPQITFASEVPTAGTYRLFLDFQHDGQVRTAEFTIPTTGSVSAPAPAQTEAAHAEGGH